MVFILRNQHGTKIKGAHIKLILKWLTDRYEKINEDSSSYQRISSGVPQVSGFEPMLFNIFINDLEENVQLLLVKFADGINIARVANDKTGQLYRAI